MNSETFKVILPEGESLRADSYISEQGYFTRSQIRRRVVKVYQPEGEEIKFSRRLKNGEEYVITWEDPPPSKIVPEPIPLTILYEDSDMVVINKPQGMVVHPAHGHTSGTLVQGLLHRYQGLEEAFGGDLIRPGLVHRLDKDTSGVIVAAKSIKAQEILAGQFRSRSVQKTYLAMVQGKPPRLSGKVEVPIARDPSNRKRFAPAAEGGKNATTIYRLLFSGGKHSYLALNILTGRTHQIRVHLRHLNCPVLGDPIYGRKDPIYPQATLMLHAWRLTLTLPSGEVKTFEAPLPNRFLKLLGAKALPPPYWLSRGIWGKLPWRANSSVG